MPGFEYAKETHKPLVHEPVVDPALVWWVDASYDIKSSEGRIGWEVQLVEKGSISSDAARISIKHVLAWRSKGCECKLASTSSAELCAMLEGVKLAPAYIRLVSCLWRKSRRLVCVTDSQALLTWLRTGWVNTDPALQLA